jgi:DNA-binding LacI/PurR family transcriptional regulator
VPTYDTDVYHMIHIRLVKQAFREVGVKINYISYDTFRDPRKSAAALSDLNGLLLDKIYMDEHTLPQFQKFCHPIVLVGTNSIEDSLLVSQVMTDWKAGFVRLQPLVDPFKRILILTGGHPNAVAQESMIRNVFTRHEIETVMFPCSNPQLQAFKYFLGHRTGYEDTVIFSLSGFFSQGLLDAFGTATLPAVIECDNMEKYLTEQSNNAVFTAIDAMLEMTYYKAIELLSRQIQQKENNRQILMIPPDLIFRKSFVNNQ